MPSTLSHPVDTVATMEYRPTAEQQQAIDLFMSGRHLAIEAGAGTGKTSTLKLIAESTPNRGQYVAFNSAICMEAERKFPDRVRVNTAHSLAWQAVGKEYAHRLNGNRMTGPQQARILGMDPLRVDAETKHGIRTKRLSAGFLAGVVMRGINTFCQTGRPEPAAADVPAIPGLTDASQQYVANSLVGPMRNAWHDLTATDGRLPFNHSTYLKLWQLSNPRLHVDYLLFDEAQDANGCMLAIVEAQTHLQRVFVGDTAQQIYEWNGSRDALGKVDVDARTYLTKSWRFGPQIADVANRILGWLDASLRLEGNESIRSQVRPIGAPQTILCRTNAAAVATALRYLEIGRRPAIVGGADEVVTFAKAAGRMMRGEFAGHRDLACFETWDDVIAYVESDSQGDELRLLVRLITEFGADTIVSKLSQCADESSCDLLLSTAHKAKGREWPTVALASDFPDPDPGTRIDDEELRLLYVAVTRAEQQLDISRVGLLGGVPQVAA